MSVTPSTLPTLNQRYRLHEMLGSGGMGEVYRAYDRLNGSFVALKQVNFPLESLEFISRPPTENFSTLWTALATEFHTLASLRHPHIISVLDYGFNVDRKPFYTMELLSGAANLLDYGAKLTLEAKVNLLIQVLEALTFLHRRGIIHRDLKPDNVLVVGDQVKVLDFGLAISRDYHETSKDIAGTFHYIAPEVFRGETVTEQADLYAFGVMAYQLLAGSLPFALQGSLVTMIDQIVDRPPDLSRLNAPDAFSALIDMLLSKNPTARGTAANCITALTEAIGTTPPAETYVIRESYVQAAQFVGRTIELEQLRSSVKAMLNGQGSAWLIGGESGVGKSRLMDEIRTIALVEGALVLRGQAVEGGGLPYQLWREPLRHLVLTTDLTDLEAGILKPVVPEIDIFLERPVPDAPELTGDAAKQRLIYTITDVINRQQRPLALFLEDLQWSGESLDILKILNRTTGEKMVFIAASYRDDERPDLPSELPGMHVLKLNRLTRAETAELSAAMLGENGKLPDLVDRLHSETEGNIFFMVEVVRALAEVAGRLDNIGRSTLPLSIFTGGIQTIVRRRLGRVPEWGVQLLKLAAVAGRGLDLDVLKALLHSGQGGFTIDQLDVWLTNCADVAVLEVQDQQWRFVHDKLRTGVLLDLSNTEQPILHRAVAEALEAVYTAEIARRDHAEALLDHWSAAGNLSRALHYALTLADYAIDFTANYAQAADLLDLCDRLLVQDSELNTPENQIKIGRERLNAAVRARHFDRARDLANKLLNLTRQAGNAQEEAGILTQIGVIELWTGHLEAGEVAARAALDLGTTLGDDKVRAQSLRNLALTAQWNSDIESALDLFQQTLTIAVPSEQKDLECVTLIDIGIILFDTAKRLEAVEYYRRALAVAESTGRLSNQSAALLNLGISLVNLGEFDEAAQILERCATLTQKIDESGGHGMAQIGLGAIAETQGDYQTASSRFRLALTSALVESTPYILLQAYYPSIRIQSKLGSSEAMATMQTYWQYFKENDISQFRPIVIIAAAFAIFRTTNYNLVAELVGFIQALQHAPIDNPDIEDQWLARELAKIMPPAELEESLKRGATSNVEALLEKLGAFMADWSANRAVPA